jgi:hypothetical protein
MAEAKKKGAYKRTWVPEGYSVALKQEKAAAKRGGTQPSGRQWYKSGPSDRTDGQRGSYTAKPGEQSKGSKLQSKAGATKAGAGAARSAATVAAYDRSKKSAAKKAASPGPRIARRVAERTQPKRSSVRMKKK